MIERRPRDVVVIGGGVTGLSTAYRLVHQSGLRVTLLERERISAGASGVQPGGVRQQWGTRIGCTLARESFLFYRNFDRRLRSPIETNYQQCGYIFVAESFDTLEDLRVNVELQNSLGIPSEILTADEAARVVPDLVSDQLTGAAYCAEDGYFDNGQAPVEAFAEAATRHGAEIQYGEVVALRQVDAAWSVVLADGSEIACGHVVVAAGYDSPELLRSLDIDLPIQKKPRYLFFSKPIRERLLDPLFLSMERHFVAKQLADGRILASDLSAVGPIDANRQVWRARIDKNINSLLPRLQFVSFDLLVEGFYDMTPDGQPVLGAIEGLENLWMAAGFSGHGFMLAPAVSDRIARAILHGDIADELQELSFHRFQRGGLVPESQVI